MQFRRLIAGDHRPVPDCSRGTLLCPASFVFLKRVKESKGVYKRDVDILRILKDLS